MELRLQKLEEISMETMIQLSTLNQKLTVCGTTETAAAAIAASDHEKLFDFRHSIKQQRMFRQRSVTVGDENWLGSSFKRVGSFRSSLNQKSFQNVLKQPNNDLNTETTPCATTSESSETNVELKYLNTMKNVSVSSSLNERAEDCAATDELQQCFSNEAEQSSILDQYTLHPFVYLHSVVKPPLAEYTSITDCIDTSTIDRPASPQLAQSQATASSNVFFQKPSKIIDYCAIETTRSAVARQESEILRLAEESQHVIINQMLSKLVKQPSVDLSNGEAVAMVTEAVEEEEEEEDGEEKNRNVLNQPNNLLPIIVTTTHEDETNNFIRPFKTSLRERLSKSSPANASVCNVLSNSSNLNNNSNFIIKPVTAGIERNYSAIFYAQTQANALVVEEEEQEDEENNRENN